MIFLSMVLSLAWLQRSNLIPAIRFEQGAEKLRSIRHSPRGPRLKTYFGGWRPGLVAHFSMFSKACSWLGRLDGFCAWGFCGGLFSLSIGALLCLEGYTGQGEAQMNSLLILHAHFTQLR
jgi:hypothetical protein